MSVRAALLAFFRQVLRIYFRKVHVGGEVPPADVRGRLFAPNHVNGLVDPLLVLTTTDCVVSPIGKAPLWKIPVLGALLDAVGAVPVVRRRDDPNKAQGANDEIFAKVGAHLAGGGNVLIFPEGTSHNEPGLVKIRSGPARMLVRALESGATDVSFQAIGLEFEARDMFRSRVLVLYGPVRTARVAAGGAGGEEATAAITRAIEADLSSVVVTGETWDERRLVARVAALLADEGDSDLFRFSELARAVRDVGRTLATQSPAAIDPVRASVGAYFDALERDGLVDGDVRAAERSSARPLRRGRIGPAVMLLAAPLALVGFVFYAIPYRVPRLVAARATEADVVSTFKLATGLVVFPLWAALLCAVAFVVLPLAMAFGAAALVLLSPFPAMWWLDAFEDGLLRPRKTIDALRVLRSEAVRAVEEARALAPTAAVGG